VKKFCHKRLASPKKFDRRSFRTITRGKVKVRIGCPRGKWDAKRERCETGTKAQAVLTPKRGATCPAGSK
jgi:hypothetical protein